MALPASTLSLSTSRMKLLNGQAGQLHSRVLINVRNHRISATCSVKPPTLVQFPGSSNVKLYMSYVREKLWNVIPRSVKEFPFKKAKAIAIQQFLVSGKEALKWSFVSLFILSSVSDIIYSISSNRELLIPFGLFVGCMITNFLKDTIQELFPYLKEEDLSWRLSRIGLFFVVVRILSACFTVGGQLFLLHVANGGLMQMLWHWKSSPEEDRVKRLEDYSTAGNVGN